MSSYESLFKSSIVDVDSLVVDEDVIGIVVMGAIDN